MERPGKGTSTSLIWGLLEGIALALGVCIVPYAGIGISVWIFDQFGLGYDASAATSLAIGLIISVVLLAWVVHRIWKKE